MAPRPPLSPRKRPVQSRSRQTVDAILEGAARVFGELGYAGATTNHIARAAGVSVGSLYEYFPNKDAVLVALAERELDAMMTEVAHGLETLRARPAPLDAVLRRFVGAMLEVHERAPRLHALLFADAPHPPELHACVLQMEGSLAHALEEILQRDRRVVLEDADTAAHLVVQTVEALTHRFVHHGIHDLGRARFIEEVVRLLHGYLAGGAGLPSSDEDARPRPA